MRKSIISGAMIAAAGLSAGSEKAAATPVEPATTPMAQAGPDIDFDMVRLDGDVLRLGGLDDDGIFAPETDAEYLAQTWGGGTGNDGISKPRSGIGSIGIGKLRVKVPDISQMLVIDPATNQASTILFSPGQKAYFDAETGEQVEAPEWVRKQVED